MYARLISEKTSERTILLLTGPILHPALIALVLAVGLFGCDSPNSLPAPPTGTVRIISSMPSKGYAATQAQQIEQAIDLAVNERSAAVGTWKVEHIALSDSDEETGDWSAAKESSNAQQAAADPSVVVYIGPYNSGAAMVSLPITNRASLLQIAPSATWPGLSQVGWNAGEPGIYFPTGIRNMVRMMPADTIQAKAAALWALQLNKSDVVILNDGSSYSAGLAQAFKDAAGSHPGVVGKSITISPTDLSSVPGQVASSSVFYAPSTVANAVAVSRALQANNTTVFATDTALNREFSSGAGESSRNWLIASNSTDFSDFSDLAAFASFARRFEAAYGVKPSQFTANAYDATNLVLDSLLIDGDNRVAISSAVLNTREYHGATGSIAFVASTGERTTWRADGYRLANGAFEKVATFSSTPAP
ncbi:MAG: branched-chain amino acid ABC transporter substrate-binding protein [Chloroflexota bacterium]